MNDPQLITTFKLKDREFLIKMNVINNASLNISITDKYTGEEWENNYEASYIENLTQRTGNFKQFHIFITMLKAGFLKTSDCISLDLLTFEDLETFKSHRKGNMKFCGFNTNHNLNSQQNNRRYLIMTYSVEFDRIHYPLPLDYCGPPDPQLLQANIRRLESEIERLHTEIADSTNTNLCVKFKQKIKNLTDENHELKLEIDRLRRLKMSDKYLESFHEALTTLEQSVLKERKSHTKLVQELRNENDYLKRQLLNLHEKLRSYATTPRQISSPSSDLFPTNSKIDLVFVKQQVSTTNTARNMHDAVGDATTKCRSRCPVRPHNIESWETTLRQQNIVEKPRHHCRSSSRDSKRTSFSPLRNPENFDVSKSPRKSRGARNRSRSTSNGSRKSCSSTSTAKSQKTKSKRRQTTSFQNVYDRTSYENLESRITALRKILSDGLSI